MSVPIANIMEPADWQDREMERLQSENAKLRELVRSFYDSMMCCIEVGFWPTEPRFFADQMRELGVEVDS